jgi:AAA+ ATPase superfamily predicted ATPase
LGLIGRKSELGIFKKIISSNKAEFVAVYGRRRVGKTFLIHEYFSKEADLYLSLQGKKDGSISEQLFHFKTMLEEAFFNGQPISKLASWEDAFELLAKVIEERIRQANPKTIVVFLDELPWLSTPKSGLLQALDYFWNSRLSKLPQFKLIVCGSAAAWMIDNLVHAKGGLYNRLTHNIRLSPFTLKETKDFCDSRKLKLTKDQILELYLALGGVPYYIEQIQRGSSVAQNIAALCFSNSGALKDEWDKLFVALFGESDIYEKIIRALFLKKKGLSLTELAAALEISVGGRFKKRLEELEEAGFISSFVPYGNKVKNTYYRILDEFSLFHLQWIDKAPKGILLGKSGNYWLNKIKLPSYISWAGISFESVCLRHSEEIATALGLSAIPHTVGTWRYVPSAKEAKSKSGAQIDLLFDREDGVITLCEIKYTKEIFSIDKRYASELKQKLEVFQHQTQTKKQLQLAIISVHGMKINSWSEDLVDQVVTADEIF